MIEEQHIDEEMEPDPELNRITNAVIGSGIAVHKELGPGHLESAYQRAMEIEMTHRGICFRRQVQVLLMYRGEVIGEGFLDLLVEEKVVVDLKATESIAPAFVKTRISYLKITRHKLGLIMNFNAPVLINGLR